MVSTLETKKVVSFIVGLASGRSSLSIHTGHVNVLDAPHSHVRQPARTTKESVNILLGIHGRGDK